VLDLTSYQYALKTLYPQNVVESMTYKDNPTLAMLPKDEKFFGKNSTCALRYADPQGRSATFSKAQANKGAQKGVAFLLTRKKDYSLANFDAETIDAASNDAGALMEATKSEIDGAFNSIIRSAAISVFRDGSGNIGRFSATTTTVATPNWGLADPNDISNFEVGMVLQLSGTQTGGAVRAGTVTVATLDRDAGTGTMTGNITAGIAAAVNTDFIYQDGDYDSKISGFDAWIPAAAPGATLYYGVDRSVDPVRLGGVRYNGTGLSVEEALIEGSSRVQKQGGRPDVCIVDFAQFANLEKSMGGKVTYTDLSIGEIGFRGILLNTPKGVIKVFADLNCQHTTAWLLQMNTWKLKSLKKMPRILQLDELKFLREASADSYEIRIGYYANLQCEAPGYNGRVTLDP
jgi:hypothetical protein